MRDHVSRRGRLAALVALCVVFAVGCAKNVPPPEAPTSMTIAPTSATIDRERRIGAMMSVLAHATLDDAQLQTLGLVPLATAAGILGADTGDSAASRKLRATAQLLAARGSHEGQLTTQRVKAIDAALLTLGLGTAQLQQLDMQFQPLGLPTEQRTFAGLEYAYTNLIVRKFPKLFGVKCGRKEEPGPSVSPIWTLPVVLRTKVSVPRSVDEVARNIDPQRWDECGDFWGPPPDATRLMDWGPGYAVPNPKPPASGDAYPNQVLLQERFKCGLPCGYVDIDQLLCVSTTCHPTSSGVQCKARDTYTVAYNLPLGPDGRCTCPGGKKCPRPCENGNSEWWLNKSTAGFGFLKFTPCTDEGHVTATKDPNDATRTILEGEKRVSFDPKLYSHNLAALMKNWLYLQVMNDSLGELACCLK